MTFAIACYKDVPLNNMKVNYIFLVNIFVKKVYAHKEGCAFNYAFIF